MKKVILILILGSFGISNVSAQYESIFGTESTSWNMAVDVNLLIEAITLGDDRTYVTNDTMINNLEYKTLEWDGLSYEFPNEAIGYVREDTTNGTAWYIGAGEEEEYLIMDLSLEVGDTFFINTFQNEGWYLVDSVYFLEDKKHVQLGYEMTNDFPVGTEKFTMIEGVGTSLGLHYQVPDFTMFFRYYTLCQQKNDVLSYTNNSPNFEGRCDVTAVGVEEIEGEDLSFQLLPNPAREVIYISSSHSLGFPVEINIYNSIGQNIFTHKNLNITAGQSIPIAISNFKPGIYYAQVITGNRQQVLSFIVE